MIPKQFGSRLRSCFDSLRDLQFDLVTKRLDRLGHQEVCVYQRASLHNSYIRLHLINLLVF